MIYARRGRSQGHVQPHHRHTIIAIYGMLYRVPNFRQWRTERASRTARMTS
ncbi:hypothetical protein JCM18916_1392 [Cutibacterium acnes JCM 18916]|nr:hypothetical protein JCM18916_1392 [Cutibacterium acnes JCM 18916]